MYFSRGNPVIYYGDEQGFIGDGGDQEARQDMFPSLVDDYNDDDLIGDGRDHGGVDNFDRTHPLYRTIADSRAHAGYQALRNGAAAEPVPPTDGAGIFAFSRSTASGARVRRRAQQLRAGQDGERPDLRRRRRPFSRSTAPARTA